MLYVKCDDVDNRQVNEQNGQHTLAVRLKNPLGSTIFSSTWHLIPAVLSYSYTTPYSRWTLSTVRLTWSFFPSMIAIVLNLSITSEDGGRGTNTADITSKTIRDVLTSVVECKYVSICTLSTFEGNYLGLSL